MNNHTPNYVLIDYQKIIADYFFVEKVNKIDFTPLLYGSVLGIGIGKLKFASSRSKYFDSSIDI